MRRPFTCGVDEVGRGPWAGPVCAGAAILDPNQPVDGLADSKALSAKARSRLTLEITAKAKAWGIGWASVEEIDQMNIRRATHLAMRRAVAALFHPFTEVLVDGNDMPAKLGAPGRAIVGGDGTVPEISAASILAKVARDQRMARLEERFPGYGFAAHKGYGTKAHRDALERFGPCPVHRVSFKPVAAHMRRLSA